MVSTIHQSPLGYVSNMVTYVTHPFNHHCVWSHHPTSTALVFLNGRVLFMGQSWVINASSDHWSMVLSIHQSPLGYVTNIVTYVTQPIQCLLVCWRPNLAGTQQYVTMLVPYQWALADGGDHTAVVRKRS